MFGPVPTRQLRLAPAAPRALPDEVVGALAALRTEVGLPAMFPPEVLDEAREAADRDVTADRQDRRDVELVTIDPPGSMDLDQAVHVAHSGEGYIVRYAIADLAAFVTPGGALDAEVNARVQTVYGPDARTPLHPVTLSEGAASLLPDEDRPAVLWTIGLDAHGEVTSTTVARALVRSRARLTYDQAQASLDDGTASESLQLLADVGRLRQSLERERGGVSLDVPEQEVEQREDGSFTLAFRRTLPVEGWNAQISLLTGMAAARLMREAGVGILRTLPEADPRDLARLRRTAAALGIAWPDGVPYSALLPTLESRLPEHAAFLSEATSLFRGATYAPFGMPGQDGKPVPVPKRSRHAAIAADYAHVTAPLRRLVDRYGTEVCLAVAAGKPVPEWVLTALADLPGRMAEGGRRTSGFERACIDIVEAALLTGREGEEFEGVVVDVDEPRAAHTHERGTSDANERGQVVLRDPAVRARVEGPILPLGEEVRVKLYEVSVADRKVLFSLLGGRPAAPAWQVPVPDDVRVAPSDQVALAGGAGRGVLPPGTVLPAPPATPPGIAPPGIAPQASFAAPPVHPGTRPGVPPVHPSGEMPLASFDLPLEDPGELPASFHQ